VTKLIGPALIAAVPAGGYLGGSIPGGWRFVPVLYAALLLVMAAVVWVGAPRADRHPGARRALGAMLAPLRVMRVWRFGLYYVVVFGAYVAFSLWLPSSAPPRDHDQVRRFGGSPRLMRARRRRPGVSAPVWARLRYAACCRRRP
jgi:hypothetical protein